MEDLVAGPHAILAALPSAEPSALPQPLRRGARWEIDAQTGQIQSSHYGRRYRLHIDEVSQRERDGLAERSEARSQAERAAIDSGAER